MDCVGMTSRALRVAIFRMAALAVFTALALAPAAVFADADAGDAETTFPPDALLDSAAETSSEDPTEDAEVSTDGASPPDADASGEASTESEASTDGASPPDDDASGEASTESEASAETSTGAASDSATDAFEGDSAPLDAAVSDAPPPPWAGFDAGEGLLPLGQYPTWSENEDHDGFSCSIVRARLQDSSSAILVGAVVIGLYQGRRRSRRR